MSLKALLESFGGAKGRSKKNILGQVEYYV